MSANPFTGAGYFLRGLSMLPQPGLRSFVLIPLLINVLLFGGAIWLLVEQFDVWIDQLMRAWLPDWGWLDFLRYLLWPLLALVILVVVYYSFSLVANFIAAPFNGFLAERVERQLRGVVVADEGWSELVRMVPRSLMRELAKLQYYLPRVLLLLVLSFIPVINLVMPLVWFVFGAWMMAIQYCDYPMDNNKVSFSEMKRLLKARRFTAVGFGSLVQFGMLVPVVNLIIMPAAVVGATIYWVEEYAGPGPNAAANTTQPVRR
ncbi:MAG: sulfate transporter CysZ [Oceanospirillaceae bacterium]|jgi:CysZ protein|uniref:sulfate transporter CysZ n=1 Tax=Marinobacterium litorale TaxID=404770 RepID=UPI0004203008|nr:sulfate transporter CysZ [Marinobacterium litorale]MBS98837.1 sulfate transporter CysZ [Oceanospirillaceae bacterium]